MALLEEVWGTDFATSPPESKQCDSVDTLPLIDERNRTTEPEQQPVTESFTSKSYTRQHTQHDGLPLFLAILVTGTCAIYAIDLFATTISRKG